MPSDISRTINDVIAEIKRRCWWTLWWNFSFSVVCRYKNQTNQFENCFEDMKKSLRPETRVWNLAWIVDNCYRLGYLHISLQLRIFPAPSSSEFRVPQVLKNPHKFLLGKSFKVSQLLRLSFDRFNFGGDPCDSSKPTARRVRRRSCLCRQRFCWQQRYKF